MVKVCILGKPSALHFKNTRIILIGATGKKLWQLKSKICHDACVFAWNVSPPTCFVIIASNLAWRVINAKKLILQTDF